MDSTDWPFPDRPFDCRHTGRGANDVVVTRRGLERPPASHSLSDTGPLAIAAHLRDDAAMNTTGTVSERLSQLDAASRSSDTTVSVPALRILGHVAEQHLIAAVAALEAHYAGHGELCAIEETLAELESEPGR